MTACARGDQHENKSKKINQELLSARTRGKLNKAPYVCNSCKSLSGCTYERWLYVAKYADDCYRELLSSSREGINQTHESMQTLDKLVSPLILKSQSLSHIYSSHSKDICCGHRTKYLCKKP